MVLKRMLSLAHVTDEDVEAHERPTGREGVPCYSPSLAM